VSQSLIVRSLLPVANQSLLGSNAMDRTHLVWGVGGEVSKCRSQRVHKDGRHRLCLSACLSR
jgi:hypothetical protein